MQRWELGAGIAVVLLGCGASPVTPAAPVAPVSWPAQSAADAYFPLQDGKVYHYTSDENGERGVLIAQAKRHDATSGSLSIAGRAKEFVYAAEGVSYAAGPAILRVPLQVGQRWPGEHGGETRVQAAGIEVTVPAGHYQDCLETAEERGEILYVNTYCAGVGLVRIDVTSPQQSAHIELQHYGDAVDVNAMP